jgi:hypothetical protein
MWEFDCGLGIFLTCDGVVVLQAFLKKAPSGREFLMVIAR